MTEMQRLAASLSKMGLRTAKKIERGFALLAPRSAERRMLQAHIIALEAVGGRVRDLGLAHA